MMGRLILLLLSSHLIIDGRALYMMGGVIAAVLVDCLLNGLMQGPRPGLHVRACASSALILLSHLLEIANL